MAALLGAVVLLTSGCSDRLGGDETTLHVFFRGGHSQAGFTHMKLGAYATFDGPYVCADGTGEGEQVVRLVDVELDPPDSGIEVTDAGVTPRRLSNVVAETAKRRLRSLPQEVDLAHAGLITEWCPDGDGHGQVVYVELHKDRPGTLTVDRSRYVYEVDGELRRTPWIERGYQLTE